MRSRGSGVGARRCQGESESGCRAGGPRKDGSRSEFSYGRPQAEMRGLAAAFAADGVGIGDRVAGYLPSRSSPRSRRPRPSRSGPVIGPDRRAVCREVLLGTRELPISTSEPGRPRFDIAFVKHVQRRHYCPSVIADDHLAHPLGPDSLRRCSRLWRAASHVTV